MTYQRKQGFMQHIEALQSYTKKTARFSGYSCTCS